jgi:hypothetical protein
MESEWDWWREWAGEPVVDMFGVRGVADVEEEEEEWEWVEVVPTAAFVALVRLLFPRTSPFAIADVVARFEQPAERPLPWKGWESEVAAGLRRGVRRGDRGLLVAALDREVVEERAGTWEDAVEVFRQMVERDSKWVAQRTHQEHLAGLRTDAYGAAITPSSQGSLVGRFIALACWGRGECALQARLWAPNVCRVVREYWPGFARILSRIPCTPGVESVDVWDRARLRRLLVLCELPVGILPLRLQTRVCAEQAWSLGLCGGAEEGEGSEVVPGAEDGPYGGPWSPADAEAMRVARRRGQLQGSMHFLVRKATEEKKSKAQRGRAGKGLTAANRNVRFIAFQKRRTSISISTTPAVPLSVITAPPSTPLPSLESPRGASASSSGGRSPVAGERGGQSGGAASPDGGASKAVPVVVPTELNGLGVVVEWVMRLVDATVLQVWEAAVQVAGDAQHTVEDVNGVVPRANEGVLARVSPTDADLSRKVAGLFEYVALRRMRQLELSHRMPDIFARSAWDAAAVEIVRRARVLGDDSDGPGGDDFRSAGSGSDADRTNSIAGGASAAVIGGAVTAILRGDVASLLRSRGRSVPSWLPSPTPSLPLRRLREVELEHAADLAAETLLKAIPAVCGSLPPLHMWIAALPDASSQRPIALDGDTFIRLTFLLRVWQADAGQEIKRCLDAAVPAHDQASRTTDREGPDHADGSGGEESGGKRAGDGRGAASAAQSKRPIGKARSSS